MWVVTLTKKIPMGMDHFRGRFFPRKVCSKKDAIALKEEVESKGGKAEVKQVKR